MVQELAKMIDHSLLHPTLTDEELRHGCEVAKAYNVASVCIKPYAIPLAVEILKDTDVRVGTVIGFPHGNSSTAIKVAETTQACKDGAVEIDMVINIGKALAEDWKYVKGEIGSVLRACHDQGAILKVIFENDFLPKDTTKIKLCEICSELRVEFVKTSTGYGMVKGSDGKYGYKGATVHDVTLMRKHSAPEVQVKAAGAVRSVDDMIKMRELGATRIGASATINLINEAIDRFGGEKPVISDGDSVEGY